MNQLLSELIEAGREIVAEGLVRGSGGNLSGRFEGRLWITRSGADLGALTTADFVPVGETAESAGQLPRPSSELSMHRAAYAARPGTEVVVHVHPPKAISLGLIGRSLPALTPDFYLHLGPSVPLVSYITPTTVQLAEGVREMLVENPAVLLQNHGVLVTAATARQALLRLFLLEELAGIYLDALATGEAVRTLSEEDRRQLDEVTDDRYKLKG
ncbi:MAG: class II aldolase/adducin family protein [Candidatus Promineifilaceae bacterium]